MFESRKAALALKLNNQSYIKMKKQERKRIKGKKENARKKKKQPSRLEGQT